MKNFSQKLAGLLLLGSNCVVQADFELLKGQYGSLQFTLNAKTAAFAENKPWFGRARENIGDPANFWWEGSVEAGIKAHVNFFAGSELYGAYSYLYAQTVGHDASGLTEGLVNPGEGDTNIAYGGWRSGSLFHVLGKNAIDISAGQQNYQIGSGFLIYNGTTTGGEEGAYWIAPRQAFQETVIGRFNSGAVKFEVFHLAIRSARQFHEAGRSNGINLEYSFSDKNNAGFTYLHVYNTTNLSIDGLDVYNGRVNITPLPFWPWLSLSAEYAFENNGSRFQANGGFGKISYQFADAPWRPKVSFRYTGLQGDNPDTMRDEGFSPLAYGFSDWGTWYQGEIIGEYVLGNSNLLSYLFALSGKPVNSLEMHLFYYHFIIDQPESLADNVTASDFADEIDLVADWQATTRLSISGVLAAAIPGDAARQFTGGNHTWLHSMVYASWAF